MGATSSSHQCFLSQSKGKGNMETEVDELMNRYLSSRNPKSMKPRTKKIKKRAVPLKGLNPVIPTERVVVRTRGEEVITITQRVRFELDDSSSTSDCSSE